MDKLRAQKVAVKITPTTRASQFDAGVFHVSGGLLVCSSCNIPVDHSRKDTCLKHLKTSVHEKKVKINQMSDGKKRKLQSAVNDLFEASTSQQKQRKVEFRRMVQEFCGANIPLKVLDRCSFRAYLETNLKDIGIVPSSHHLRQTYLPTVFDLHREEIKQLLVGSKSISLVCDETTDARGRCIFNLPYHNSGAI